jgi:nitrate reductase NapAB chaperone NapD
MTVMPPTGQPLPVALPCPEATSVASWVLVVDRPCQRAVRSALGCLSGVEYRTTVGGHLVIVSESRTPEVEQVHERLQAIPDVREVALVSVYEDTA